MVYYVQEVALTLEEIMYLQLDRASDVAVQNMSRKRSLIVAKPTRMFYTLELFLSLHFYVETRVCT